jgi:tripartite-type tricarboxylate transporter receptor subunit TctC
MLKNLIKSAAVAALIVPFAGAASAADDYPSRNIEMMFPWGPGSAFAMAQIITNAMGEV